MSNDLKPSYLDTFKELVSIPVQSRDERAIADVIKQKLTALGLTVTEDGAGAAIGGNTGNVIARLPNNTDNPAIPPLFLSSHLDRVKNHGKIVPVVNGDLITSDGTSILAADDVAGLCGILETLRILVKDNIPHGDIEVALTVGEEAGLLGAKALDYAQFKAKEGYILDAPGRFGRIVTIAPTQYEMVVTVKGRPAHAGNEPEKGLNALMVAATALLKFPDGRISPDVTVNFGTIHGGIETNVVCDKVVIRGETRGTDEAALQAIIEKVKAVSSEVAAQFNTTIDVETRKLYNAYHIKDEDPLVEALFTAMTAEGVTPHTDKSGGASDGNFFNEKGIKTVVLAMGYSKNHTKAEQVYHKDISTAVRVLVRLIENRARATP